jgi:hypothetical protein
MCCDHRQNPPVGLWDGPPPPACAPPISWGPMLQAERCLTGAQTILPREIPAQLGRNLEPESRYRTVLIYLR